MNETTNHGILRVTATERADVTAASAKLHLRVEGETFLIGNAVTQRSREVRDLVATLKTFGVTDAEVSVEGVQAKLNQGLLTKGTKVTFELTVTARDVAAIGDLLGVIANARHAELERVEWVFDDDEIALELSSKAMAKAHRKASTMAAAIGYVVVGIRAVSDSLELPKVQDVDMGMVVDWMGQEMERSSRSRKVDVGTEFKATREIAAVVSAEFVIKPKEA
jgi:uncharacterized protein YggE